jgi:hypothetical protein
VESASAGHRPAPALIAIASARDSGRAVPSGISRQLHDAPPMQALQRMGQALNGTASVLPVQRQVDPPKPDLRQTTLDTEAPDQSAAVGGARSQFREALGKKMIALDMVPAPAAPYRVTAWLFGSRAQAAGDIAAVQAFEDTAWEVTEALLPALLHGLNFDNGLAAIGFAQDIFLKFIAERRDLLTVPDLRDVLRQHLLAVIAALPAGEDEEEEDEDEDAKKREVKSAGKTNKRYLAALARIDGDAKPDGKVQTPLEAATARHKQANQTKYDEALELFTGKFKHKNANAYDLILKFATKLSAVNARRLFTLFSLHDNLQGDRGEFQAELKKAFATIATHGKAREDTKAALVALGLLTGGEGGEADVFYRGEGGSSESQLLAATDLEMKETSRAQGLETGALRQAEKTAKEQDAKEKAETLSARHAALMKEVAVEDFAPLAMIDGKLKDASAASVQLLQAVLDARRGTRKGQALLLAFEDSFATYNWEPGLKRRLDMVDALRARKLLPGVDDEILKYGDRSAKGITDAAVAGSWATQEEIDVCGRLLGPSGFIGILDSHMRRGKPGPLRAMIEQMIGHREKVKLAPPLTSHSLVIDTNMVEMLVTPLSQLNREQAELRRQLNDVIAGDKIVAGKKVNDGEGIKDIRLANMNIAELSGYGSLIGTVVKVQLNLVKGKKAIPSKELPIYGVPYHASRGSGRYAAVFKALADKKVGENKGNADRSMMADIYLAEREKGAAVHFATADLGVAKEIGPGEDQFDPAALSLPTVHIHTMEQLRDKKPEASAPGPEVPVKAKGGGHVIWDFAVGDAHTVRDITRLITGKNFQVVVVGGAVRDFIRGATAINDVDMKTNMPVDQLVELFTAAGLAATVTSAIKLVKVGKDEQTVDIVSTAMSASGVVAPLDLEADALTRDFTLNALYLRPPRRKQKVSNTPVDPRHGLADAKAGRLRFSADPGSGQAFKERALAILAHLKEKPENFGRALKFLQRGHKEWREAQAKYKSDMDAYNATGADEKGDAVKVPPEPVTRKDFYHVETEILDFLRKNAVHILSPIVSEDAGPHKKGLFIHQSGFKTPMELVEVMQRLNFPLASIRMVYPDTVAGAFADQKLALSRDVSPRFRAVGPVSDWDPAAAPKVKVDTSTGRIYQYRVYAYAAGAGGEEKLLIDVDYSDHAVPGHPAPHYHVYRAIGDTWKKNESGYSTTGQPGEPPIRIVDGRRAFTGPQMWRWWDSKAALSESPAELRKAVEQAAKDAGVPWQDLGASIAFGDHLVLPYARLDELARSKRIPMLLQLLHNLGAHKPWNPADNTVETLTGSRENQERLRFKPQLAQVYEFLKKTCGIANPDEIGGRKKPGKGGGYEALTTDELARLYDLVNASHSPEIAGAAARYAVRRMGSAKTAHQFVNYFEYYVASTKNRVGHAELDHLHRRTITHAGPIMAGSKVKVAGAESQAKPLAAALRKQAATLKFRDEGTAAYHLHKHLDMVDQSAEDLTKNNPLKRAARQYIEKCRATVKDGELQKTVADTENTLKFYFSHGETIAIVELDLRTREAHLLTGYNTNTIRPVFLTTPYVGPADSPGSGRSEKAEARPEQSYRTPFGTFLRLHTPPDGNCFFHAIRQSAGLAESATQLRTAAANELRTNYAHNFNGTTYTDFITRDGTPQQKATASADYLGRNGNWSASDGDLVPELMARSLNRTINILSRTTGELVQTMGPANINPIAIFYNGGSHYEASRRQI